jgi:hypothetical protein
MTFLWLALLFVSTGLCCYGFKDCAFPMALFGVAFLLSLIVGLMEHPKAKQDTNLEFVVKCYINELANPAPDSMMRAILVQQLAEMVKLEDPVATRCRWLNDAQRSESKQQLYECE